MKIMVIATTLDGVLIKVFLVSLFNLPLALKRTFIIEDNVAILVLYQ